MFTCYVFRQNILGVLQRNLRGEAALRKKHANKKEFKNHLSQTKKKKARLSFVEIMVFDSWVSNAFSTEFEY